MINKINSDKPQSNSLINNSNKFAQQLANSTPSLVSASNTQHNRSPFYSLNNANSSSTLMSSTSSFGGQTNAIQLKPQPFDPTASSFNKYNHLSQYQQQQTLLSNRQPFNLAANNSLSPNNQFGNYTYSPYTYTPNYVKNQALNLSSSLSYNSMPRATPILRPTAPLSFNNPTYFMTPSPVINSEQENYFFSPTEQEMLDDGFLNLLKNTDTNNISNKLDKNATTLRNNNLYLNADLTGVTSHLRRVNSDLSHGSSTQEKKEKNLIDLDTWIETKELSIIDLFDPLAQTKVIESNKADTSAIETANQQDESQTSNCYYNQSCSSSSESAGDPVTNPIVESSNIINKFGVKRTKLKRNSNHVSKDYNGSESKLTRIANFKITEVYSNTEFESFNKSINELSSEIVDKKELVNLIVFSPILDCPITKRSSIKIIIRYTSLNGGNDSTLGQPRFLQEIITPSLNATVETVVYHILNLFDIEELNTEKYLLKIHGLEEYLPIDANLGELKYLHDCLNENKDPILILTEIEKINTELSMNKNKDLSSSSRKFKFSTKFEKNKLIISKMKLENLLRSIIQNRKLIEESVEACDSNMNQLDSVLNWCINLKEKFKVLIQTICNIHFGCVETIIEKLEFSEKNLRNYQSNLGLKEKQPLMVSSSCPENEYCVVESGVTDESLQYLYANLLEACDEAMHVVLIFVNCAADSYNFPFKLKPIYTQRKYAVEDDNGEENEGETYSEIENVCHETERIEIIQSDEKFFLHFNGLSRLNEFLKEKSARFR